MKDTQRLAISAAHSSTPLALAARAAGYSINDLAALETVKSKPSTLREGHSGRRPIAESLCLRVRDALGVIPDGPKKGQWRLPATIENWPRMEKGV
jgi:hypothetical protein